LPAIKLRPVAIIPPSVIVKNIPNGNTQTITTSTERNDV
jgi:hypothetical protein